MKKLGLAPLLFLFMVLSGCELIGDIFQAGMVVGIIAVGVVVGLLLWIIGKLFR